MAQPTTATVSGYGFNCAACHDGSMAANHVNGPITSNSDANVFFGYTAPGKNPSYGSTVRTGTSTTDSRGFKWTAGANGTCANTYCHSNGKRRHRLRHRLQLVNWKASPAITAMAPPPTAAAS